MNEVPFWIHNSTEKVALFRRALEDHRRTPHISLDAYMQRRRSEYGKQLLAKKRIYLDINHWINLAEVHLGRAHNNDDVALYDLLSKLVAADKVLCPVSYPCMTELFKQIDPDSRKATAQVFDRFSLGSAIQNPDHLLQVEVLDFLFATTSLGRQFQPLPIKQMVWTKAAYYAEELVFTSNAFPADIELAIQKAQDDLLWSFSFEEWVAVLSEQPDTPDLGEAERVEALNQGKFEHANEFTQFDEVFLHEMMGTLDVTRDHIEAAVKEFYRITGQTVNEPWLPETNEMFVQVFYAAFKAKKMTTQLANFRIRAGVHAAKRYNRTQKFKAGDSDDLIHAATALPYFDYFVTERPLACLLTNTLLKYNELYGCTVLSSVNDLIAALHYGRCNQNP